MIKKLGIMLMLFCCVISAIAATPQPQELAAQAVKIISPIIDNTITKNNAAEVFMQVDNQGKQTQEIVAAYSPLATQTQLHKSVRQHGQLKMRQVQRIKIKPRHERMLKLGGLHVMLIGLKQPLTTQQTVPTTLIFHDGSWMTITVRVVNHA